eukprot:7806617-Alexandrium_andersonii.AAC.1
MSASLVGSEMCIRDSSETSRPGGCCDFVCSQWLANWAEGSNTPQQPRTCLLYTSDAADDM